MGRAAFCEIGAVAMGRELWAMGFSGVGLCRRLCCNRSLRSLAAFGGMGKVARGCPIIVIPGYDPGSLSEMFAWLFSVIGADRHETVRRETVHVRRAAFCDIGAVAMRRAVCGMRFKRCLPAALCYNRSLVQANRSARSVATQGDGETLCKACSLAGVAGIKHVRRRMATPEAHHASLLRKSQSASMGRKLISSSSISILPR